MLSNSRVMAAMADIHGSFLCSPQSGQYAEILALRHGQPSATDNTDRLYTSYHIHTKIQDKEVHKHYITNN